MFDLWQLRDTLPHLFLHLGSRIEYGHNDVGKYDVQGSIDHDSSGWKICGLYRHTDDNDDGDIHDGRVARFVMRVLKVMMLRVILLEMISGSLWLRQMQWCLLSWG